MPRPLTPLFDPVTRHGRRAPNPIAYSLASGALTDQRDTAAGTGTSFVVYGCHTDFSCTGAVQTYTVSAGVTTVTVTAAGAQGASSGSSPGGKGGSITGIFDVVPGTTYDVYVGCVGIRPTGGWSNGGRGVTANNPGKGGGGATYFVPQGGSMADALIVGGAGGGGSDSFYRSGAGGYGGYPAGGVGAYGNANQGGTQSVGGTGDSPSDDGDTDGQGEGGDGYAYGATLRAEGGGGGGGWHGGGAGKADASGGGGGSSYVDTGSGTQESFINDINTGDGSLRISEPGQCDLSETVIVPAISEAGVLTVGSYDSVRLVVSGTCFYIDDVGWWAEADYTFQGHGGGLRFQIDGGAWQHIEPVGGAATGPAPGAIYEYLIDGLGAQIRFGFGDSVWGDNIGQFNVDVYA